MDNASRKRCLWPLQWWKDSGLECTYSDYLMDWATKRDTLKFFSSGRSLGWNVNGVMMHWRGPGNVTERTC